MDEHAAVRVGVTTVLLAGMLSNPKMIERTPDRHVWKADCVELVDFATHLADILVGRVGGNYSTEPPRTAPPVEEGQP